MNELGYPIDAFVTESSVENGLRWVSRSVDVVVNDGGAVTGALVVSSSKSTHLDNAALAAAMKTKFAPRHGTGYFPMRVFHLDYEFQDDIQ